VYIYSDRKSWIKLSEGEGMQAVVEASSDTSHTDYVTRRHEGVKDHTERDVCQQTRSRKMY
jgi:hypothetical protein